MQTMYASVDGVVRSLEFPAADEEVLPGIRWGGFDELLTPAYWRGQAWQHEAIGTYACLRLGRTLVEETAACLLGGYGMPAELGLQAYSRLRARGLLQGVPSSATLEEELSEPFPTAAGLRRYRFPRQKARYLSGCLAVLDDFHEPDDDMQFRDALAELPGIGPKTASWIVRNHRASDYVAVLDVHTNASGVSIATNIYDAFGDPGSSNLGRYQYTGQTWFSELGLYHYKGSRILAQARPFPANRSHRIWRRHEHVRLRGQ